MVAGPDESTGGKALLERFIVFVEDEDEEDSYYFPTWRGASQAGHVVVSVDLAYALSCYQIGPVAHRVFWYMVSLLANTTVEGPHGWVVRKGLVRVEAKLMVGHLGVEVAELAGAIGELAERSVILPGGSAQEWRLNPTVVFHGPGGAQREVLARVARDEGGYPVLPEPGRVLVRVEDGTRFIA